MIPAVPRTTEPQSGKTYGYSSENLLTSATGGVTLGYDPALRLYQTAGATTTRFLYDGVDAIAEYNGSNALQRRFVFDPTTGQPVLWYEGTGTAATNRRYLGQDERGSVISVASNTGAMLGLNSYDEYGKPGATNLGRYQYTGQKWIGEAGLYDYKARDYLPHLGIFAQTDPVGQEGGPNLYPYVGADPINWVDPLGLDETITCIGERNCGGGVDFGPGHHPCPVNGACITAQRPRVEIPPPPLPAPRIASSPSRPAPPKPRPKPKPTAPCGSPSDGPVNFTIDEFTTAPGGGVAVAWGTFTTGSGGKGTFESSGFALGFDLGLSQRHGSAQSLGTFTGTSDSLSGGLFGFSFDISRSQSSGEWYGSVGLGASKPKVGGSVSTTDTNILTITCP